MPSLSRPETQFPPRTSTKASNLSPEPPRKIAAVENPRKFVPVCYLHQVKRLNGKTLDGDCSPDKIYRSPDVNLALMATQSVAHAGFTDKGDSTNPVTVRYVPRPRARKPSRALGNSTTSSTTTETSAQRSVPSIFPEKEPSARGNHELTSDKYVILTNVGIPGFFYGFFKCITPNLGGRPQ